MPYAYKQTAIWSLTMACHLLEARRHGEIHAVTGSPE